MLENILLTSENFVRTNTNISDNLQSKYLIPAIREAQEMDLVLLIGSDLLNRYKADISGNNEIVGVYNGLLQIIQYFLAYKTISNVIITSSNHIDNFGVSQQSDENLYNVNLKDQFKLSDFYNNKADFYKERIRQYCIEYYDEIPELHSCSCYRISPNLYSSASCSVNLGNARGKSRIKNNHIHYDRD